VGGESRRGSVVESEQRISNSAEGGETTVGQGVRARVCTVPGHEQWESYNTVMRMRKGVTELGFLVTSSAVLLLRQ
jgi:hypothetical protein